MASNRFRRAADFAGKNPSNVNRSVGNPEIARAAIGAEGPGRHQTP